MSMIKLPKSSISYFEEHYPKIFVSGNLAEGEWNKTLQEWTTTYTAAKHAFITCSNGSGLFCILTLLKHYRGYKHIFIQSNTMYGVKTVAITSGLNYLGSVECSFPYLMPSFEQVRDYIDGCAEPEKTVFLLTHIGGWTNPHIKKIAAYCKEKGVALVEDCAHSLGSTLEDKHTGTYGVAGVYSLYATKAVPAGEGGLAVTNDEELSYYATKFLIYDRFEQKSDIGINFRLSELGALIAYSVVKETENIITNKQKIAKRYIEACKNANISYLDPFAGSQRANLYKFILLAKSENPEREFQPIISRTSPVYDYSLGKDTLMLTKKHICLPIWYDLDDSIIEEVLSQLAGSSVFV